MTSAEIAAGGDALKTAVDTMLQAKGERWEEMFIPETAYLDGTTAVINAADAAKDQSAAGRQSAGAAAFRRAIDATGHGAEVTDAQCATCAAAVLAAVGVVRAKEDAAKGLA